MKPLSRRSLGTTCLFLSILVLFAVSVCATHTIAAGKNLTYIGEAVGPDESLTYYLQGPARGETVVLIPGMRRGASDFRELAAALNKAGYRTVAMQPRGIGRSGPILTTPTYNRFAANVAAHVKNAAHMKKTYPDRVTMAVVLDAGHAMLAEQPAFIGDRV